MTEKIIINKEWNRAIDAVQWLHRYTKVYANQSISLWTAKQITFTLVAVQMRFRPLRNHIDRGEWLELECKFFSFSNLVLSFFLFLFCLFFFFIFISLGDFNSNCSISKRNKHIGWLFRVFARHMLLSNYMYKIYNLRHNSRCFFSSLVLRRKERRTEISEKIKKKHYFFC